MDVTGLIREGARLKEEIDQRTRLLRAVNRRLADSCDFTRANSTRLEGGGWEVRISQRENVRWDQERLRLIRGYYDFFDNVFRCEYKPAGSRELAAAMSVDPTFGEAVEWARTVRPGAPSVTYKRKDPEC
ncbi:MAG: hypothetical protein ACLFOY_05680 [Desulfatibacillaceae bacterium]